MMNYNVIAYYDDATITCETNDINVALTLLLEHGDVHIEVIDGFTGKILCAQNCEDPILQDAFGLCLLGFMMKQAWGATVEGLSGGGLTPFLARARKKIFKKVLTNPLR